VCDFLGEEIKMSAIWVKLKDECDRMTKFSDAHA